MTDTTNPDGRRSDEAIYEMIKKSLAYQQYIAGASSLAVLIYTIIAETRKEMPDAATDCGPGSLGAELCKWEAGVTRFTGDRQQIKDSLAASVDATFDAGLGVFELHGVFIKGTEIVVAHTGCSTNSARIAADIVRAHEAHGPMGEACAPTPDRRAEPPDRKHPVRQALTAMESAWYELQPGDRKIGDQFIRQNDMQKKINLLRDWFDKESRAEPIPPAESAEEHDGRELTDADFVCSKCGVTNVCIVVTPGHQQLCADCFKAEHPTRCQAEIAALKAERDELIEDCNVLSRDMADAVKAHDKTAKELAAASEALRWIVEAGEQLRKCTKRTSATTDYFDAAMKKAGTLLPQEEGEKNG